MLLGSDPENSHVVEFSLLQLRAVPQPVGAKSTNHHDQRIYAGFSSEPTTRPMETTAWKELLTSRKAEEYHAIHLCIDSILYYIYTHSNIYEYIYIYIHMYAHIRYEE